MSSGENVGVKRSKPFILEQEQNSYSIEIEYPEDYRSLAICPDYVVDTNFNLNLKQCQGRYEKKWMLLFSKEMPSSVTIDLKFKDCDPNLLEPKKAVIIGCE